VPDSLSFFCILTDEHGVAQKLGIENESEKKTERKKNSLNEKSRVIGNIK